MADSPQGGNRTPSGPGNLYWIYGLILLFIVVAFYFLPDRKPGDEITYQKFQRELVERKLVSKVIVVNKRVVEVYLTEEALKMKQYARKPERSLFGTPVETPSAVFQVGSLDNIENYLQKNEIEYSFVERVDYWGPALQWMILLVLLFGLWMFFMRRIGGGMGGSQIFNIGKSRASLFDKENRVKVTFNDVAGLEEAKEEVVEIVDFLKNPQKFTRLGGHIPKGVLLVGPPGTGKTLLAKAVAGEAQVPFFSLSGSDFVEMFVGVGAARVRDLFKQAKEKAPCIVFIDEIDAIGRSRGRANVTGGNDERENTLNQLLVEMDGFNTDSGVILMAATNRPDVLDGALMRPGRFDRQIAVDRPDLKEREAIFNVHLANIVKDPNLEVKKLAAQTPGFVGADIMNVCNEAALIAARNEKNFVDMQDFQDAIDRVIGGLEKKNKIISPEEKKIVAYHEAGHAIAGWYLEHTDPLVKVSIVPRGVAALGYAQYLPKEQYLYTYEQLIDQMCMALGGRVAEDIIFSSVSTGAQNDLERITHMAYAMVTLYGMNPRIGNVSFNDPREEFVFKRPYSESTAETIDEEVRIVIDFCYQRTKQLLVQKREFLETIAKELLQREVIFQDDLARILGPRPNDKPTSYEDFMRSDDVPTNGAVTEEPAPSDVPPVVPAV